MAKIVIIGNSAAGIAAAEVIRERDKASDLLILSEEDVGAYQRDRIVEFIGGSLKEKELIYRTPEFYKEQNMELLLNKKVIGVNVARKRLITRDKQSFEFDKLVIASGSKALIPKMKGSNKYGVIALNGLSDARFLCDNLGLAHTVLVIGESELAHQVSGLISSRGVDVKLFSSGFEAQERIEVFQENFITEFLGDSDLKAVRLSNNKVIGASVAIFCSQRQPSIDFVSETDIQVNEGILVDNTMRTNVEFIWAAGDCCVVENQSKEYNWSAAVSEGRRAGEALCQT